MAKTWLFALGICLWHTHSHYEHMLHACHSPCKGSKSETFTLSCRAFIALIQQRPKDEKERRTSNKWPTSCHSSVQSSSILVFYNHILLTFLQKVIWDDKYSVYVLKASVEFCRERHMCLYIDSGLVEIPKQLLALTTVLFKIELGSVRHPTTTGCVSTERRLDGQEVLSWLCTETVPEKSDSFAISPKLLFFFSSQKEGSIYSAFNKSFITRMVQSASPTTPT